MSFKHPRVSISPVAPATLAFFVYAGVQNQVLHLHSKCFTPGAFFLALKVLNQVVQENKKLPSTPFLSLDLKQLV